MSDEPRPRWFHLTPDKLLLALVPVWAGFFLSDRFGRLPKGYPVLLATAIAAVILLFSFLWFVAAVVFRWRFQYSVRTLLLSTVIVSVWCSWVAVKMQGARRQERARKAILKLAGDVTYDYELDAAGNSIRGAEPPGPAWLRRFLGEDFLGCVVRVHLHGGSVTDKVLAYLEDLPELQELTVFQTQVTDAGLEHLRDLHQLQELRLIEIDSRMQGTGLEHLKGLTQLRVFSLDHTRVTDTGLEHLEPLTQLEKLNFAYTDITDAGLQHLKGLTRLRELYLTGTHVTGVGLEHLRGLPQLELLVFDQSLVNDAGLGHLKGMTQLKRLYLDGSLVTDAGLQHLSGLFRLQSLSLSRTQVTDSGLVHLGSLTELQDSGFVKQA